MKFTIEKGIAMGIHLGHPTRYWNPKIDSYTYGTRNGISLIDLVKTRRQLEKAKEFLKGRIAENNKNILFIGTKKQATHAIKERAEISLNFFVNERWLGGILTNWSTVKKSLLQLHRLEREEKKSSWISLPKTDVVLLRKRQKRLEHYLGGLKGIQIIPNVAIVVGQTSELVAIQECRKIKIPIICPLDTDCNPDLAEIGVPINDDSRDGIHFFLEILLSRLQLKKS
jgi:small subunit ribosomal protein S2